MNFHQDVLEVFRAGLADVDPACIIYIDLQITPLADKQPENPYIFN